MACDAQTLENLSAADQLAKLSDRSLLAVLSNLYGLTIGSTATSAQAMAVANGYNTLSELEQWQCFLAAICSGACDANSLSVQTGLNKYDRWSQRDIFEAMVSAACLSNCSAQSLQASMVANGYDRLAFREILATLVANACTGSCSAKALFAAAVANGYDKFSFRELTKAIVYVICATGGAGTNIGTNIVPPGSTYAASGIPVFNLTVLSNTTYQITWGSNDQSMTMGNETYVSGGSGSITIVYTNGNTNMAFLGTNNGTTVTVIVQPAPKAVPVPGDFQLQANTTYTNVVASWDIPPSRINSTEVWTSTDGVTYSLNQTVAAPGTSANLTLPAVGSSIFCKVRWIGLQTGAFSGSLQFTNTDWATRVVTNGGASPAAAEIAAVNNFNAYLINNNLMSSLLVVNPLVGSGNLAAMQTPLIKGASSAAWAQTGANNTNCTVNGFGPAGGAKLDSGFAPTSWASSSNAGMSLYAFTGGSEAAYDMGTFDGGSNQATLRVNNTGNTVACMFAAANQFTVASPGAGFYSLNRVSATDFRVFFFKSTSPTAQLGSTLAGANGALFAPTMFVGCLDNNGGTTLFTSHTLSGVAYHNGLNITQVDLLAKGFQAMRQAAGGGFV